MNHWDSAQIYHTSVLPGESADGLLTSTMDAEGNIIQQQNETRTIVKQKFTDFVKSFMIDDTFVYREQLRQNLLVKHYFIEVDLADMAQYDEELANRLKYQPSEYISLFEEAVKGLAIQSGLLENRDQVPHCQVMLLSNDNPIPIRELDSTYISKLVRIPGIIISVSSLGAKATDVHIMCKSCRHNKTIPITSGLEGIQLPRKCDNVELDGSKKDCPLDPYVIIHDKSKFVDQQQLKIQETADKIPVGEIPRHMQLVADRYLTRKVIPGTRVTVTGVYRISQSKSSKGGSVATRTPYLRVIGMETELEGTNRNGRTFSEEEEEEFQNMAKSPNFFETFANSVAPSIFGFNDIKKAITCLLVGGSKKILPDGMRLRGDINVLLLGDPGTAKSQMLKFVEKVAPIAVYTSGKGSSAAGLTASVIRDPTTREFTLEGGAMVLADGGVVCIDEFDKMREEDRVAIHEAMEQQTISIAKAGITTILNSRAAVLAAANPIFGRYDDMKSPGENIEFQSTILSRFDLIFIVKDEHNESRDKEIARHVINLHKSTRTVSNVVGDIDIQKMRSYISYCRSKCAPRLADDAAQKLCSHFVQVRSQIRNMAKNENIRTAIPITVRQLEAIVRISESLAKISLSPVANEHHVDEAIRLFNISTLDAVQATPENGSTRPEFNKQVEQIQQQIRRRLAVGSQVSSTSLSDDLTKQGFSDMAIDRAIHILVQKEILRYMDRRLVVRRIAL